MRGFTVNIDFCDFDVIALEKIIEVEGQKVLLFVAFYFITKLLFSNHKNKKPNMI